MAMGSIHSAHSRRGRFRARSIPAFLTVCLVLFTARAAAQTPASPGASERPTDRLRDGSTAVSVAAPPTVKAKPGIRAYGLTDVETLSATESFKAVFGSARVTDVGAGADIVNLWKGLFARFAFGHEKKTGSRVIVDASQNVFSLNIPLTVSMTPVELAAGWRLPALDRKGRFVPYAGAGMVLLHYAESSAFSLVGEDIDEEFTGSVLFAGVEVRVVRFVNVGVEGLYRRVVPPAAAGGVATTFDENTLSGAAIRFRFGVGF